MQAEVVEGLGEVGDVGLDVALAQHLALRPVGREAQLLAHRQHQRPQARQVLLQRLAGHLDQIPVQLHAHAALLVLPLVHAPAAIKSRFSTGTAFSQTYLQSVPQYLLSQHRHSDLQTHPTACESLSAIPAEAQYCPRHTLTSTPETMVGLMYQITRHAYVPSVRLSL